MANWPRHELEIALAEDDKVKVAGIDIDGVLRGKIMNKKKFLSLLDEDPATFGFCGVIFGWDIHDQVYPTELSISNSANGYADILARIDLDSYRRIPFENNIPFFLVTFLDVKTRELLFACPRAVLQSSLDQLKQETGFDAYAGAEYEYFQFKETPDSAASKRYTGLTALTPGNHGYSLLRPLMYKDYFHQLYDDCKSFGIEIEGHHTETGDGVYETALAYTDASKMADNATLFKLTAKAVGLQHGIIPSFMAKPYADKAGCSGHVHISLRKGGKNAFAVSEPRKNVKYPELAHVSQECEYFLAGLLKGLPDLIPCLIPTVNGYKRLVEGFWAPTTVSWGYESRLASVRVIGPPSTGASATRLEIRMPGADMNAHLTIAAILRLGTWGIREKLQLEVPPISANNKEQIESIGQKLPKDLKEAAQMMMRPESIARKVMGDQFVDHFGATRLHEWKMYNSHVSAWELERYLELA